MHSITKYRLRQFKKAACGGNVINQLCSTGLWCFEGLKLAQLQSQHSY